MLPPNDRRIWNHPTHKGSGYSLPKTMNSPAVGQSQRLGQETGLNMPSEALAHASGE